MPTYTTTVNLDALLKKTFPTRMSEILRPNGAGHGVSGHNTVGAASPYLAIDEVVLNGDTDYLRHYNTSETLDREKYTYVTLENLNANADKIISIQFAIAGVRQLFGSKNAMRTGLYYDNGTSSAVHLTTSEWNISAFTSYVTRTQYFNQTTHSLTPAIVNSAELMIATKSVVSFDVPPDPSETRVSQAYVTVVHEFGDGIYVDLNALLLRQQSKTVLLNGLLRQTFTKTVNLDAVLKQTTTITFDMDAELGTPQTAPFYLNTVLKGTLVYTHNLDAVLKHTTTKTTNLDSLIQESYTKTVDIDAELETVPGKAFDLDAVLKHTTSETVNLDAELIIGAYRRFWLISAIVVNRTTKTASLNAVLKQTTTKTIDIDAELESVPMKVASLDAKLYKLGTKSVYMDAVVGLQRVTGWDDWQYEMAVTIDSTATNDYFDNDTYYTVSFPLNTAFIISEGKMKIDCSDLVIVNEDSEQVPCRVDWPNTTYTRVFFRIPAVKGPVLEYTMLYGNPKCAGFVIQPHATYHSGYFSDVHHFYDDWVEHPVTSTEISPLETNAPEYVYKSSNGLYINDTATTTVTWVRSQQIEDQTNWPGGFWFRCVVQGSSDKKYRIGLLDRDANLVSYIAVGTPTATQATVYIRGSNKGTFNLNVDDKTVIDIRGVRKLNGGIWSPSDTKYSGGITATTWTALEGDITYDPPEGGTNGTGWS